MSENSAATVLPYPLNNAHAAGDMRKVVDTLDCLHTLLEQSAGLARVLKLAAESGDSIEDELAASLEILSGYCSTTLALFERWQEARQAQQAEAEAKRQAWMAQPLSQDADAVWAEIRALVEQDDTPERPRLTALVRMVRTLAAQSGMPLDGPPDSPEEEGA